MKLPNHHIHASLPIIAYASFHSPSCLLWYPRADQKRGRRWQAVKTRLLWNSNFINICQKSPTLSLNFRNVIKRLPLSLCPKPLADVEVFSNVSFLVLSWEASTHFLENPKNSFSLQLVPKTAMKYKKEGKKGASLQQHWTELKINNMISLGFHLPSSSFWLGRSWALSGASFFHFSQPPSSVYVGCFSVRCQICLDWTWEWCEGMLWRLGCHISAPVLFSKTSQPH